MPLTVKFRDIEKDILDAVRCGRYEDASNSDSDTDLEGESDGDEDNLDDSAFTTLPQHQVPDHGKGIPLHTLAPDSGANLLSPALLDMLSDTPHAGGVETNLKGDDVSATDQDSDDDLEKAFADW
jgi:hypothetical protein